MSDQIANDSIIVDQIDEAFREFEEEMIMNQSSCHVSNDESTSQDASNSESFSFQSFSEHESAHFDQSESESEQNETIESVSGNETTDNDNDQNNVSITSFKTKIKKKLRLKNLTLTTQQHLINTVLREIQSSIKEDEIIVNIRDKSYHTEYIIKYLHSVARFIIRDVITFLFSTESSLKSVKSTFNSSLTRIYCELVRNNKRNKKWKSKVKVIVEKSCFISVLDKKTTENLLMTNSNAEIDSNFHFIDNYDSKIAEANIWFIQSMSIRKKRREVALHFARQHYQWKIKATIKYNKDCKNYVMKRIDWEWKLLNSVLKHFDLQWSSVVSFVRILQLTNSFRIRLINDDYRKLIEEKNDVK